MAVPLLSCVPLPSITDPSACSISLGADSLDTVELVMAFEEAFSVEIPEDAAEKIATVKDAIDYIEKQKQPPDRPAEEGRSDAACGGDGHGHRLSPRPRRRARVATPDQRRIRHRRDSRPSTPRTCRARSPARCRRASRPTGGSTSASGSRSRTRRRWTASSISAMVAATEAVEDSGWVPETEEDRCATGVMIGSGIGGLETIYEASILVHEGKARRLSPFFIPSALINLASGHVSIKYGFKGPNHSRRDRLRHRRARDRRRGAADHAGRRRRDGRRRRRGDGLRARHRRVLRLARAVHRLQRPARRRPRARGTRTATAS